VKNPNAPRQAIALKYDGTHAPTLSAKGDEELAEEILRIARDCELPIYENAELVSLLAGWSWGTVFRRSFI
jgi:flagellar biosynthesis protein